MRIMMMMSTMAMKVMMMRLHMDSNTHKWAEEKRQARRKGMRGVLMLGKVEEEWTEANGSCWASLTRTKNVQERKK